jgi:hypothetical protein
VRLDDDRARVENIPFFVRGIAVGDVVLTVADDDGVLWAKETVEYSNTSNRGNVVPAARPPVYGERVGDTRQSFPQARKP